MEEIKARRYDEVIERAKEWYNDPHITIELKGNLEDIFPELKESEEERIRKWLIDTIKAVPNDSIEWEKIDKSDVIAWLEKQREKGTNGNEREILNSTWSEEDTERYISCLQHLGTGNLEQPETINSKWFKEHIKIPAQVQRVIAL